jgi:hypothetical protein
MEARSAFFEVGTEVLKIIKMSFGLQRVTIEIKNLTSVSNVYQISENFSKPFCVHYQEDNFLGTGRKGLFI